MIGQSAQALPTNTFEAVRARVAAAISATHKIDNPESISGISTRVTEAISAKLSAALEGVGTQAITVTMEVCEEVDEFQDVPQLLKDIPNWVVWKDASKAPFIAGTNQHAKSTDSSTWRSFDEVKDIVTTSTSGIGFMIGGLAVEQRLVGFDLDGCLSPDRELTEWADAIIEQLDSYTEVTPSGTGVRIWVIGDLPSDEHFKNVLKLDTNKGFGDKVQIEVYSKDRYFTVTGDSFFKVPGEIKTRDLTAAYELCRETKKKYPPVATETTSTSGASGKSSVGIKQVGTVITTELAILMSGTIKTEKPFVMEDARGALLNKYPSQSEADAGLAYYLALEHGDNAELIASEFGKSPLGARDKWTKRKDYRDGTISFGIKSAAKATAEAEAAEAAKALRVKSTQSVYAMTPEEIDAELEKDFPVIPLIEQAGPTWDDDILYGLAGEIITRASEHCEAHPAGMYLDLLVSLGNIFGRSAYFNIGSSRHYTNEFMVRVGATSDSRKGTGRDVVDAILKLVDPDWFKQRVMSGFGSAEAIVHQMRDPFEQQIKNRGKTGPEFKTIIVPGVTDKRTCVREGELASIFQLASKGESRADIVLRDGWDGRALQNIVKGKSQDGISNSAQCSEPHLSISGDTTASELKRKMPDGSDQNGFGNRFLYCYVYRTKKCPLGGPEIDWSTEIVRLLQVVAFAKHQKYVPLTASANTLWKRMYLQLDEEKLPGMAGNMTARSAAHIRRLALILALIDLSDVVESKHLKAARRLWEYCEQSARFIFNGSTKEQDLIVDWVRKNGPTTLTKIREDLFKRNKRIEWIKSQIDALTGKRICRNGDVVTAVI
jgi:hypothetical protein